MNRRGKSLCMLLLCLSVIAIGCGKTESPETAVHRTENKKIYKEEDYAPLPDEGIITEEGKSLSVDRIERDREGRPAMYIPEQGVDDGEYYRQITEYALNDKGEWERKDLCAKSLTRRVVGDKRGGMYSLPYVIRGDDGELYALLLRQEEEAEAFTSDEETASAAEYYFLHLNEEKDAFTETELKMDDDTMENVDTSPQMLGEFHVMEDGTLFMTFEKCRSVCFDPVTGSPTAVCENIPDKAFTQNVGYGEKEFIFYSSSQKKPGVLDPETMTVTGYFGDEVEESYRQRKWNFETRTEDWTMFGFNTSGLYEIRIAGRNVSMDRISREHAFDDLEDAVIYDVMVNKNRDVYALIRKKAEDSYAYQNLWDFGIVIYRCAD